MPADIKSAPNIRAESLQGAVFVFHSEQDRIEGIDKAFDYRGDVTLTVRGAPLECFLFNREAHSGPPRVEVFLKGSETPQVIPYGDIEAIAFTGKDTADGKSWGRLGREEGHRAPGRSRAHSPRGARAGAFVGPREPAPF